MASSSVGLQRGGGVMDPYLPSVPPRAPKAVLSYPRSVLDAPYTALAGIVVDGRQPDRHPVTPRCRVRHQVGLTNRWRLPESLGCDLLGTAQAIKSTKTRKPDNSSITKNVQLQNETKPQLSRPNQRHLLEMKDTKDHPPLWTWKSHVALACPSNGRLDPIKPGPVVSSKCLSNKPMAVFQYHSERSQSNSGPDVLLRCLGMNWELHRPLLQKSRTLSDLLTGHQDNPGPEHYYKNIVTRTLDDHVNNSLSYTNKQANQVIKTTSHEIVGSLDALGIHHPKHISEQRINNMTVLELEVKDILVTPHALALALGNLYHKKILVDKRHVVGVLGAGHVLQFSKLVRGCVKIMMNTISSETVSTYHGAATKYGEKELETACERWLEVNLIPKLTSQIQLKEISLNLLQRIIKSNRLFTYSEYSLYKLVVLWTYLYLNPEIQIMPTYNTVLAYFESSVEATPFLDREEGEGLKLLYMSLRLQGIVDVDEIKDIQKMNIIPQSWILNILNDHYRAVQGGGDMSLDPNFNSGAIRHGFLLEDQPHYHSEVFSLHGFHFELKAMKKNTNCYTFYMQRLKPSDPLVSFLQCERHTFSMRPDRRVLYNIRAQSYDNNKDCQTSSTGVLTQDFGLGSQDSKSQSLTLRDVSGAVYVTFSVLFPPS